MEVREASAAYAVTATPQVTKGYKQTEVGVIPEDWDVATIGELSSCFSGGTPSTSNSSYYGGNIPWITSGDLNSVRIKGVEGRITADGLANSAAKMVSEGALLLALYGATAGVSAVTEIRAAINQAVLAILPKRLNTEYLFQFLRHRKDFYIKTYTQGGQPNFSGEIVKSFLVPLPPTKAEQEAIAEALSDADALIESLEHLLAKKRQIKQGAMQQLLTGKKRLPGFRGEWEVKPLGDLFNFSGGFTASRDQLSTEGYCYLHYGDIHTSNKTFVNIRSEYQNIPKLDILLKKVPAVSLLDDGDVVFVDASEDDDGTSKHVVIVNPDKMPFISGLHTIVAKSRTNELDHLYRRYCFQTPAVKAQFRFFAVGTKVSGISKTNIAKITLPVPSVPEQTAIAAILSDMDAEIAALEEKLAKARRLKQGMMQELLTGRIRLV